MLNFAGKNVLVTGGGVGIGRAIVEAFRGAGARVMTIEHRADRADALRAALPDVAVVDGDVTLAADVAALAQRVGAEFGKLDVLVNNVGDFLVIGPYETMSDADEDRVVATNLGQVMRVTKAMIPHLKAAGPGSSIISITSIEAFRGVPNCVAYGACKAGVTGFTMSLSLELAPHGIRINATAPGGTDAPPRRVPRNQAAVEPTAQDKAWYQGVIDQTIDSSLMHRYGTIDEQVAPILFFASDESSYITGSVLPVAGGDLG